MGVSGKGGNGSVRESDSDNRKLESCRVTVLLKAESCFPDTSEVFTGKAEWATPEGAVCGGDMEAVCHTVSFQILVELWLRLNIP